MNEICSKTFIDMFVNYVQKKKNNLKLFMNLQIESK